MLRFRTLARTISTSTQLLNTTKTTSKSLKPSDYAKWNELNASQKVVRSGQFIGYSGVIAAGVVLMGAAFYYVGLEIWDTSRDNSLYSRILEMLQSDERCLSLIGNEILGPTQVPEWNTHSRRGVRSVLVQDDLVKRFMQFRVKSKETGVEGIVSAELIPSAESHFASGLELPWSWDILVLYVDVRGKRRLFLVDNRTPAKRGSRWFNLMGKKLQSS